MPKNTKEERLRWIQPVLDREISLKQMALIAPFSPRTLKYWLANFRKFGLEGLEPKSTRPFSHPHETPIRIKERILELRQETNLGAMKIYFKLKKEGIKIHPRTVAKVLKQNKLVRIYKPKKERIKYVKAELKKGELIEIDVKFVPEKINGVRFYQFTAIDCATKWRYLQDYDAATNEVALMFLKELLDVATFRIHNIKTDNAVIFTNRSFYHRSSDPMNPRIHAFDKFCQKLGIKHYLIDPGKPAQNGFVEASHRTDQMHFYDRFKFTDPEELRYQTRLWNMYYNDLEHISLNGLTPNEAIRGVQNVCS